MRDIQIFALVLKVDVESGFRTFDRTNSVALAFI
jgi:hypothetical protein